MTPLRVRPIPELTPKDRARFESKIAYEPMSGCWLWMDHLTKGYGNFSIGGRAGSYYLAHRVSYTLAKGPIPDGLSLDHLCRNPACVNPDHLEAVPIGVNIQRAGLSGTARENAALTGCQKCGGPLTLTSTGKQRHCYPCALARQAEWERNRYATDPEYADRRRAASRVRSANRPKRSKERLAS